MKCMKNLFLLIYSKRGGRRDELKTEQGGC
jgi:hypothetical protein